MSKFRQKYRIASARRPGWDYRTPGAYFITICTHDRHHFFGSCTQGVMTLSPIGDIVRRFWYEIPQYSPNVELGAFVVMPNHVHGILILTDWPDTDPSDDATMRRDAGMGRNVETRQCHVSTPRHDTPDGKGQIPRNTSTHDGGSPHHGANDHGPTLRDGQIDRRTAPGFYRRIVPQSRSVSTIIGSYKSACTKYINQVWPEARFRWQERFHDHIIRNARSFDRISEYIIHNPENWEKDCFAP